MSSMQATLSITLTHHRPENLWTASARNADTAQILGGLFTSSEAALAACWLTIDERIALPGIASYEQVRELLDARLSPEDAAAVAEASEMLIAEVVPS